MTLSSMIGAKIILMPIFGFVLMLKNSPMLKLAIERAIKKFPHHDSSGNLLGHDLRKHWFVGFVSSNTKSNALILFHLHSFVTFYTDLEINTTVITSTLTTQHHILFNMQDCLLQLIQLMQYRMIEFFSVTLSNSVIGSDVTISQDSLDGFLALGFDKSQFDEDGRGFTLSTMHPICIVQYHDLYTWAKYCQRLFPFNLSQVTNTGLHESFRKIMIEFLQTNINQYSSYSVDQVILDKLQKFLQGMSSSSSDA
jgi:hypothetical protein